VPPFVSQRVVGSSVSSSELNAGASCGSCRCCCSPAGAASFAGSRLPSPSFHAATIVAAARSADVKTIA
jgi:hypothetical protein